MNNSLCLENKFRHIISTLIEVASMSTIGHKLSSVIIKGNKMISKPVSNIDRNFVRGYMCGNLHAECNALLNYYGSRLSYSPKIKWCVYDPKCKNKTIDLIVIKINTSKELCCSRPCLNCLNMMKKLNVSNVYYSTSNGSIICEKVKDMLSIQSSFLTIHMYYLNNLNNLNNKNKNNKNNKNKLLEEYDYFEKLLIDNLPNKIKKYNLECFITHNLINVLPYNKYEIKNNIFTIKCKDKITMSSIY
jgi:deoxycytidylate deaminase